MMREFRLYRRGDFLWLRFGTRPTGEQALGEVQPFVHLFETDVLIGHLSVEALDLVLKLQQAFLVGARPSAKPLDDRATQRGPAEKQAGDRSDYEDDAKYRNQVFHGLPPG